MADQNLFSVDFTELNTLKPFFDDQEKIMNATMVSSFLKGGGVMKKALANSTPAGLKKFNSTLMVKKYKPSNGILQVAVGYFGRKIKYINKRGKEWDAFYLLYWKNYGTLRNRDSGHNFQYKIRSGSINKNGGISPSRFFDLTAEMNMESAYAAIEEATDKELNKAVIKYGFK